jgi:hypothetical protein
MKSDAANSSELWPFRPRPLEDESFSSWFSRLAWENGLLPPELYRIALPGAQMYRLDLDRFASADLISEVSRRTAVSVDDLQRRTLRNWCGRIFEYDDGRNKLIWLPPAGTEQTSKSFGQQVCPRCMRDNQTPHLSRYNRLAFVTVCSTHKTLLIDRCPECAAPIQPLYLASLPGAMWMCWHCGFDLRRFGGDRAVVPSFQRRLIEIADTGWGPLNGFGYVHAISWFRILWTVYRLLATGRFAYPLREWAMCNMHCALGSAAGIPRIKEIELLNPRCRQLLLEMAFELMKRWPERFTRACREVGIHARVLIKDPVRTPFALWSPVQSRLKVPKHDLTDAEIKEAKAFLSRSNRRPTYRALVKLLGSKFESRAALAEPASDHLPYGGGRYWKLDGVSPETKAAAKAAAKCEGENVGPWVEKILRAELLKRESKFHKSGIAGNKIYDI